MRPALAEAGFTVFAAASMKTALDPIAVAWKEKTGKPLVISYGSSGTLAKQIEKGAPADLFISADQRWVDVLAKDGLLRAGTRQDLLGNVLVLVQPATLDARLKIVDVFPEATHAPIVYPVAVLNEATNPAAADFETFLRSDIALDILKRQGFRIIGK